MKPITILICSVLLIISSCNPNINRSIREIDVIEHPVSEDLSKLIQSYEVLLLDKNPDAYISNPGRTIYTDSLILIKNESNQSIVIFNNTGEYLSTISKRGRGPKEYLYISDFTYDPIHKIITIYDSEKAKFFNLEGKFISETKLGFRPSKATNIGSGCTLIEKVMPSGDSISDFYLRLFDKEFNTISARLPIRPLSGPGFGTEGQTYRTSINGDHAYFFSYFGDTIYHINNKHIKPAYVLNYHSNIITVTDGTDNYNVDPITSLRYLSYFEIGEINLLYYSMDHNPYCFVFNSSDNTTKLFKSTFKISDTFKESGNIMIDAIHLDNFIEKNDPNKTKCKNLELLNKALEEQTEGFQCIVRLKLTNL